jgi:hypothetical protein
LRHQVRFEFFFYNPNVHPQAEYDLRKNEIVRYAAKMGVPCLEEMYDPDRWDEVVRGHEADPERGSRCSLCFEMRLLKTAEVAASRGYSVIATTLAISRRKNCAQVAEAGRRAAAAVPGITYLDCNWRKQGGVQRMDEIVQAEGFYRQQYCGCHYSQKC